jgi:hypothetical protein
VLDTNITFYKLLKFLSKTNTKGYEICNVIDDNGDSIYTADIEELAKDDRGQVFISETAIEEVVNRIIDQQQQTGVGSSLNNNMKDD